MTLSIGYKIIFRLIDVSRDDVFTLCSSSVTRIHSYYIRLLYKPSCTKSVRSLFLSSRIINVWNSLPTHTDFCSLNSFMRTVESADLSQFLKYEK